MNAESPAPTVPARSSLSLRELFCLMTLACGLAAILCWAGSPGDSLWTYPLRFQGIDERWLLVLGIGGTLTGILLARAFAWRSWPLGLALGGTGSVVGTCVAFYYVYQEYYSGSPAGPAYTVVTQGLWGTAILGGLIALMLPLVTMAAFSGLLWLSSGEPTGAFAQARHHPWRALTVAGLIAALVLLVGNLESWLWPRALAVRAEIPFEEEGVPLNLQSSVVDLALSHDGRYLAVSFELWDDESDQRSGRTWLFDVSAAPRRIDLTGINPKHQHQFAFDTESDRLALFEWDQPIVVLDVGTGQSFPSIKSIDGDKWFVEQMQWLAGGQLAVEEEHADRPLVFDVASGAMVEREPKEQPEPTMDWDSEDPDAEPEERPDERIRYEPRFRHEYRFVEGPPEFGESDYVALRVHDLATRELLWNIPCNIRNGDPAMVSRDGRFIMQSTAAGAAIVNVGEQKSELLSGSNWMFSSRGHVVHSNVSTDSFGFREYTWPEFVPFVRHLDAWWNRARVCWLDPDTGRVIARTAPLPNVVTNIAISHDGSTIAAATWTGVYVFDVPAKLR